MDYSRVIDRLIVRQLRDWDVAGANYEALAGAVTRTLHLGEATITLQFNPERRRSSAAAIDKKSISSRKCFLCSENQPAKQKAMLWGDHYKIQVNPYPIFSRHLTIADLRHVPQRLAGRVGDMLSLAKALRLENGTSDLYLYEGKYYLKLELFSNDPVDMVVSDEGIIRLGLKGGPCSRGSREQLKVAVHKAGHISAQGDDKGCKYHSDNSCGGFPFRYESDAEGNEKD